MVLRGFILLCVLGGCLADFGPEVSRSDVTGVSGITSSVAIVSDHPHHVIYARVQYVVGHGRTVHAVQFGQSSDGVHPRLRFTSAWSDGQVLPFRETWRTTPFCSGLHCPAVEIGKLFLSRQQITNATNHGISLRLTGPDGAMDVSVPAHLFVESQERAAAQRFD